MTLTKPFDFSALKAALKSSSLAGAPALVGHFFSVVLGWTAASLTLSVSSNAYFAIGLGFIPKLIELLGGFLATYLPGIQVVATSMILAKAWDKKALISALEAAGIPDAEAILESDLQVLFDWLASSLNLMASTMATGGAFVAMAATAVTALGTEIVSQLQAYEKALLAKVSAG